MWWLEDYQNELDVKADGILGSCTAYTKNIYMHVTDSFASLLTILCRYVHALATSGFRIITPSEDIPPFKYKIKWCNMSIFLRNSIIRQQFEKVSSLYVEAILEFFLSFYKMLPSLA